MKYFLNRLGEASTWSGVGSVVASTAAIPPSSPYFWLGLVGGLLGVFMPNAVAQQR